MTGAGEPRKSYPGRRPGWLLAAVGATALLGCSGAGSTGARPEPGTTAGPVGATATSTTTPTTSSVPATTPATGATSAGPDTSATLPDAPSAAAPTVPVLPADTAAGPIVLHAYGIDGAPLDYDRFAAIETNGVGRDGVDDALVDPTTLQILALAPLYGDDQGRLVLDRPAGPAALSLAWPTTLGYSTLIIDLPAPGTYVFNVLAAEQAVADATRWNAAAPTGGAAEFSGLVDQATAALADARRLVPTDEVAAARAADRALDSAVRAALLPRWPRRSGPDVIKSVTIDRADADPAVWPTIAALAGDRAAWARIVFDPDQPASTYRPLVDAAHAAGVKVLGQILDSSAMAGVPLPTFRERVDAYLAALPDLDGWEVGNEVNGTWLGPDVTEKIAYAARAVKERTSARTMLTLYWQLGEDTEAGSMFTWAAANLTPAIVADLDDVSVSMWVEEHPMGIAFDRVFATLAARFPGKRLLIGELGYGNDDLSHLWWWGDATDRTGAGRIAVAHTNLTMALDRPWIAGGGFWWYYLEDAFPANALRAELADR